MTPTVGTTLGLTVDPRWTHGVFLFDDKSEMELPFLGWAPVVIWVAGREEPATDAADYEAQLQPVFMDDNGYVDTLDDVRRNSAGNPHLVRLIKKEG
ncbi:hypothetical protein ABGB07_43965 [Micromonosporaceae bacterium B7E4]